MSPLWKNLLKAWVSLCLSMIAMKYISWHPYSIGSHFSILSELLYLFAVEPSSQLTAGFPLHLSQSSAVRFGNDYLDHLIIHSPSSSWIRNVILREISQSYSQCSGFYSRVISKNTNWFPFKKIGVSNTANGYLFKKTTKQKSCNADNVDTNL